MFKKALPGRQYEMTEKFSRCVWEVVFFLTAVGRRNDARKAKGWTLVFRASSYLLSGRLARWRKSLAYSAGKACSERFHCSMNLSIISVPFSVQHPRSITMMVLTKISLMV